MQENYSSINNFGPDQSKELPINLPFFVPFNRNVELGNFANSINAEGLTHQPHSQHISDHFQELINSKLGLQHVSQAEQFYTVTKKAEKPADSKQHAEKLKKMHQSKTQNEDIIKKHKKDQEIAISQGRDEKNSLDKILSSLSNQQSAAHEKRRAIEELNFKNIDNNQDLIFEITKAEVKKDFKIGDPQFMFQIGKIPRFSKEKLSKVKARSPLPLNSIWKQWKFQDMPVPENVDDNSADPVFLDVMDQDSKKRVNDDDGHYSLFATDSHLASILVFMRSRVSWNLYIKKDGYNMTLYSDENSCINNQYPYENNEKQEYNKYISEEQRHVNQNVQAMFDSDTENLLEQGEDGEPDWWLDEADNEIEDVKKVGYNYIQQDIADNIVLFCRSEVHAYLDEKIEVDEKQKKAKDAKCFSKFQHATINSHCLLDVEPGKQNLEQRTNLEKNPAQLANNEFEWNNHIISKWTTRAWLAKVDYISLGQAVRKTKLDKPLDQTSEQDKGHYLVSNTLYKTENLTKFLNLNPEKSMSIIKFIVNCIIDKDTDQDVHVTDGVQCLHKIPPNPKYPLSLRLYKVNKPKDTTNDE